MIARLQAVGMIETVSIAAGIEAADAMVKAASVAPLLVKTTCPGKFVSAVHGDVAAVEAAVGAGRATGAEAVVDWFVIANISPQVVAALACPAGQAHGPALGVIETYTAASAIVAADAAAKAAEVQVAEVRLAMGLGGKAVCLLTGDVAAAKASVEAGAALAGREGLLVRRVVIPNFAPELLPYVL